MLLMMGRGTPEETEEEAEGRTDNPDGLNSLETKGGPRNFQQTFGLYFWENTTKHNKNENF